MTRPRKHRESTSLCGEISLSRVSKAGDTSSRKEPRDGKKMPKSTLRDFISLLEGR